MSNRRRVTAPIRQTVTRSPAHLPFTHRHDVHRRDLPGGYWRRLRAVLVPRGVGPIVSMIVVTVVMVVTQWRG